MMVSATGDQQPFAAAGAGDYPGLWRDGNQLVIDLAHHQFPLRCLKSNSPVDKLTQISLLAPTLTWLEKERFGTERRLAGSAFVSIVRRGKGPDEVRIDLQLPLSPAWQWIANRHWAFWPRTIGIVGLVGAYFVAVGNQTINGAFRPSFTLVQYLIVVFLPLTLLGFLLEICLSSLLPIKRLDERKIWLARVNRQFLSLLPPFAPSLGMLERRLHSFVWQKWTTIVLAVAWWVLALVVWLTTSPLHITEAWLLAVLISVSLVAVLVSIYSHWHCVQIREQIKVRFPAARDARLAKNRHKFRS